MIRRNLAALFDLRRDQDSPDTIDNAIRDGVSAVGTNLWVLILAILIASVGLNTNSTAVIIGAMLISPLMGPIVGIGYGIGIKDFALIRLAGRTLLIFTLFSLIASSLYFLLSPLDMLRSELLARTTPTIWDVLIAFFGGAAGIVAISRKEISNVVPGVAIATALMPPLCTAGFGLAHRNWSVFGGALYLYGINSVFIALATLMFVKILKFPERKRVDEGKVVRTQWLVAIVVSAMIVPSAYFGYRLVQDEIFSSAANAAIAHISKDASFSVVSSRIDKNQRKVQLFIVGSAELPDVEKRLKQLISDQGIADANVHIKRAGNGEIDWEELRKELRDDLYSHSLKQIELLNTKNQISKQERAPIKRTQQEMATLAKEIRAQYPEVDAIAVASGFESVPHNNTPQTVTLITLQSHRRITTNNQKKIQAWLIARFDPQKVQVVFLRR